MPSILTRLLSEALDFSTFFEAEEGQLKLRLEHRAKCCRLWHERVQRHPVSCRRCSRMGQVFRKVSL